MDKFPASPIETQIPPTADQVKYEYTPLPSAETGVDHIRLLYLEPSTGIRGSLRTIQFPPVATDDTDAYVALSYAWGDPARTHFIFIDGQVFGVTANLLEALFYLNKHPARTNMGIWVDAICINQGDDVEKSSQVRLMCKIYAHAHLVHIDLGGSDNDIDHSLRNARSFSPI